MRLTMENNKAKNNIKSVQIILIIFGILTIGVGLFASKSRLIELVSKYLSTDKNLSDQTVTFLSGVQIKIILIGIVLILLSASGRVLSFLKNLIIKYGPILIERIALFFRNFAQITYKITTNEKFIWGFIIVVLLTISLPTVYYSPSGGFSC